MEKRLKNYLLKMENQKNKAHGKEELEILIEDLLLQIQFFQHERLIHLIVTITFAILTMMVMLSSLFLVQPMLWVLVLLLVVLLVPYIRHYYILENGVQKLYTYHDFFYEEHLKNKD